jgi:predicted small secreted protein
MMKKLIAVSMICCSLLGCQTADGVMSGIQSVADGVSGDIDNVRNKD